jgi:hypothetical protein
LNHDGEAAGEKDHTGAKSYEGRRLGGFLQLQVDDADGKEM